MEDDCKEMILQPWNTRKLSLQKLIKIVSRILIRLEFPSKFQDMHFVDNQSSWVSKNKELNSCNNDSVQCFLAAMTSVFIFSFIVIATLVSVKSTQTSRDLQVQWDPNNVAHNYFISFPTENISHRFSYDTGSMKYLRQKYFSTSQVGLSMGDHSGGRRGQHQDQWGESLDGLEARITLWRSLSTWLMKEVITLNTSSSLCCWRIRNNPNMICQVNNSLLKVCILELNERLW